MKVSEVNESQLNAKPEARSIISFLGMQKRESLLIKIVLSASPRLAQYFKCLDDLDMAAVDILFIDADSNYHLNTFLKRYSRIRCVPVLLHSGQIKEVMRQHPEFNGCLHVSRPVKKRDLNVVLQNAIRITHHSCPRASKSDSTGKIKRLLVVDRDASTRAKLFDVIVSSHYRSGLESEVQVEFAASGAEAIGKFATTRDNYDYVCLQEDLQQYDSYRICLWMKTLVKELRVFVVTNAPKNVDMHKAFSHGCDNYLVKPLNNNAVEAVLKLAAQTSPVQVTPFTEQQIAEPHVSCKLAVS